MVGELIVSPHSENPWLLLLKYREYLQKLYSLDTWCLTEQTNVLRSETPVIESIIQHARYGQLCGISAVPSLTPQHSKLPSISSNSWGPELFRLIFHSWFIWYPLDISRAFERTTHMTISSTLKFTNMLPYAWKYHRIDSTELIQKRGFD